VKRASAANAPKFILVADARDSYLLNRALTANDIVEMYEAGRPEYVPKDGESDVTPSI